MQNLNNIFNYKKYVLMLNSLQVHLIRGMVKINFLLGQNLQSREK